MAIVEVGAQNLSKRLKSELERLVFVDPTEAVSTLQVQGPGNPGGWQQAA